jgi:hypothetical protein
MKTKLIQLFAALIGTLAIQGTCLAEAAHTPPAMIEGVAGVMLGKALPDKLVKRPDPESGTRWQVSLPEPSHGFTGATVSILSDSVYRIYLVQECPVYGRDSLSAYNQISRLVSLKYGEPKEVRRTKSGLTATWHVGDRVISLSYYGRNVSLVYADTKLATLAKDKERKVRADELEKF